MSVYNLLINNTFVFNYLFSDGDGAGEICFTRQTFTAACSDLLIKLSTECAF